MLAPMTIACLPRCAILPIIRYPGLEKITTLYLVQLLDASQGMQAHDSGANNQVGLCICRRRNGNTTWATELASSANGQ